MSSLEALESVGYDSLLALDQPVLDTLPTAAYVCAIDGL